MPVKQQPVKDDFWAGTSAPAVQNEQAAPAENEDWKMWQEQAPTDDRNNWQKAFDQLTAQEPHGTRHTGIGLLDQGITAASNFGSGVIGLATPFFHPQKTAESILHPVESLKNLSNALQGPKSAETIEQGIPGLLSGMRGGRAAEELTNPFRRYQSPVVPSIETASERLGKAILPAEGVTPNLTRAIQREAPAVREYASRTGNPLRTIPEGIKAAEGVAQEGLGHYRSNFLDPFADNRVVLGEGISPELGHSATIGQIEKRISDINDLTRGAVQRAKSSGAEMTAQERLGLENEGKALRQNLYQALSERTGVSPQEIQNMREGYGGEFALKNALESGHFNRLTRTGMESQGAGSGIYPSKAGIVDKLMTTLRGGPERIANRQFRSAIKAFEPSAPVRPMSNARPSEPMPTPFRQPVIDSERVRALMEDVPPKVFEQTPGNRPMAKAPAVLRDEQIAKQFNDAQNAAYHAKLAANRATAGKRLIPKE